MSKAINLPSVQAHSTQLCIQASIGFLTIGKIQYNLDALHDAQILWWEGVHKQGYCLLIDELALEEQPRYDGSQDAVVGIVGIIKSHGQVTCFIVPYLLSYGSCKLSQ